MKSLEAVFSRCRPMLGTFVSIGVSGANEESLSCGVERAFTQVSRVADLMSFHHHESELARLNRHPVGKWMEISEEMAEVLSLALALQVESGGQFNIAVGIPLVAWSLLPGKKRRVNWKYAHEIAFEIEAGRARRLHPVLLDLGGIAKGYAVDRAVKILQEYSGKISGCVNAGGDLRAFGKNRTPVWVRSSVQGRSRLQPLLLENAAIATSTVIPQGRYSVHIDPKLQKPLLSGKTAVVQATQCVIADAFTKIALLSSEEELNMLSEKYGVKVKVFQ